MPAAIPDRFNLEMRLGRDGDIEEWLATDTSLDRPVLVRSLGPETSPGRRRSFVVSVSDAAKASHPHLARVFAVSEVEGGAYSVCEWTGGSSAADRVEADHTMDLIDFAPNASGLAGALAAIHETGSAHGAIDLSAISYSVAHAAKLGGFGRAPRTDERGDVRALSAALESALTGSAPGGPPPSERIDGVPKAIDRILRSGQSGDMTAAELEKAFLAAPTLRKPTPEPRAASRRLIIAAALLVVVAVGLVALGRAFSEGGEPILPPPAATAPPPSTVPSEVTTTASVGEAAVLNAASFDPFGEGGENDNAIPWLWDGDISTSWQTERYQDPLPLIKDGVGVTFTVSGSPARLELVGLTVGTVFEVHWSDTFYSSLDQWTRVAGAQAPPGAAFVDLPHRVDGFWLIWLTDLPLRADGFHYSSMAEVRFRP
jgi:serine/threonine protein kinase